MLGRNIYYTRRASPRCFVLDKQFEFAGSNTSKPKRTVMPIMYMFPPLLFPIRAFSKDKIMQRYRIFYKIKNNDIER